jgi:hypothetical protein
MYEDDFGISKGKVALYVSLFIVFCLAMDWVVAGQNFFLYKFFAPRQAAVERQVYENTKSYKQGNIQRLNSLCLQVKQEPGNASMLNDVINHEFAEWSTDDVPDYLRGCLLNARK